MTAESAPARDPLLDPAPGDCLIVGELRHVHVLGVAPDTSGEPLVQVSVMLPSKYHYLDTWRLGWYRREVAGGRVVGTASTPT